jgi:uncharacterized protein involved in exopolysaccharide biosynthesis
MADEPLVKQLSSLRSLLEEVDTRLARAPVAPPGLEELKQSVDTLRTNMWAILSAGHGALAPVRIERLKLSRAIDGIRAISAALASRAGSPLHPEHLVLQLLARELADQIDQLR